MTQWYYSDYERNRHGPVAAADLAELHRAGQLQADTLVWGEGMANWRPWREVMPQVLAEAEGRTPAAQESAPLSSGVNPYAMAEPVLAAAAAGPAAAPLSSGVNPYAVAEPQSPYAPPRAALHDTGTHVGGNEIVYAGFWKRVAAYFIDGILMWVVTWFAQMMVMGLSGVNMGALAGGDVGDLMGGAGLAGMLLGFIVVPIAINTVYFAWMHSSSRQATLGKMAVGIKVTDDAGYPITFMHGVGRYFASMISGVILCVGYLITAFTDRKRALHDIIAGTLVVDQWAFTAHPERQNPDLGTVTKVILGIFAALVVGYLLLIVALIGLGVAAGQ